MVFLRVMEILSSRRQTLRDGERLPSPRWQAWSKESTRNRNTKLEHQREHTQEVISVRKSIRKHDKQHARAKQDSAAVQARLKNPAHTNTSSETCYGLMAV